MREQTKETSGVLKHLEHNYVDGKFKLTAIMIEKDGSSGRQDFFGYIPRTELGKEVYLCQWINPVRFSRKFNLTQKLTIIEDNYQIVGRKLKQDREFPE